MSAKLTALLEALQRIDSSQSLRRVHVCRRALSLVRREQQPTLWAALHTELATSLAQYGEEAQIDDIEEVIAHYQHALAVYTREDYPELWAAVQNNLANVFKDQLLPNVDTNIEKALGHFQNALVIYTRKAYPELWAVTQVNLAGVYLIRREGRQQENIEHAIACCRGALTILDPENSPEEWALAHTHLAHAYRDRRGRERPTDLERARSHYQHALSIYTADGFPEDWARTQANLAHVYVDRVRGKRAENLEHAITCYEQALSIFTHDAYSAEWAAIHQNLAAVYRERIRGERAENLERALLLCQSALSIFSQPDFPEEWASVQVTLANCYAERLRVDYAENLEHAIEAYHQALRVYTKETFPDDWANIQHNLAAVYRERVHGDRQENLEQAIQFSHDALSVRVRDTHPEQWAATQTNLAAIYRDRLCDDPAENIEQSIAYYQNALNFYTAQTALEKWSGAHNDIAIAYQDRRHGDRAENIEQSITHCRHALRARKRRFFPEEWAETHNNLAVAYQVRVRGDSRKNVASALSHYKQALEIYTPNASPMRCRLIWQNIGYLYFNRRRWREAYTAYKKANSVSSALFTMAFTEEGRRYEVRDTARIAAALAYCLLKRSKPGEALVALEGGKTRLLREALAINDFDLRSLPESQQQAIRDARSVVHHLETERRLPATAPAKKSKRELAKALSQARTILRQQIEHVRCEYPDSMVTDLLLGDFLALCPTDGALVVPLFTAQGSAVFILPHGTRTVTDRHIIWLERLTDDAVYGLLRGPTEALGSGGWLSVHRNATEDLKEWCTVIAHTGQILWDVLIRPICEHLKAVGVMEGAPIVFIPPSGLGLLPLHAAWHGKSEDPRYFLDEYSVSYAPSGYALSVSQDRAQALEGQQPPSILAVINPTEDLPFAAVEGRSVLLQFDSRRSKALLTSEATADAVVQCAPQYRFLHFCCHGSYNWRDTMKSGLALAGGTDLTLATIISHLNLHGTRLVTLSACETGVMDVHMSPDEFLGLPAGFLQAGAAAVISTLWAVNDVSTMLLMERFYTTCLSTGSLSHALRDAQSWLRKVTAGELAARFKTIRQTSSTSSVFTYEEASQAWRRFAGLPPETLPFSHPYYWAAFTVSGM